MAKKKAAAKKPVAKAKPVKKAAPAKPVKKTAAKPQPKATKASKPVAGKAPAPSNGVGKTIVKKSAAAAAKKAAVTGSGNPSAHKAKSNGTADDKGLNPQTYQMLRQDIISTLWKYDEITFDELCAAMEKIHGKNFVNDSQKYLKQVVSDLMNIDLIEQVEQGPERKAYRIRQRLGD
jgi:hypothetical protein